MPARLVVLDLGHSRFSGIWKKLVVCTFSVVTLSVLVDVQLTAGRCPHWLLPWLCIIDIVAEKLLVLTHRDRTARASLEDHLFR
jgi:hypothetical protein